MKTATSIKLIRIIVALAVMTLTPLATPQEKGSAKGGGAALVQKVRPEAPKAHVSVAMPCSKCKTIASTATETQKGRVKITIPTQRHECEGCSTSLAVTGHGKAKKEVLRHSCTVLGENLANCCATMASK